MIWKTRGRDFAIRVERVDGFGESALRLMRHDVQQFSLESTLAALSYFSRIFWLWNQHVVGRQTDSHVMSKFQLYDMVRVVRLPPISAQQKDRFRPPCIGDTGAVVMVYETPQEGYTVEAVASDERTEWLTEFSPDDLERA